MKHLSAKQNFGYIVHAVKFDDIYRCKKNDKWMSITDWCKNDIFGKKLDELGIDRSKWREYLKEIVFSGKNQVWGGFKTVNLTKSIKKNGLQYPLTLIFNRNKNRIEFKKQYDNEVIGTWSTNGWSRIKYALIHDYTSIDVILFEDINEMKKIASIIYKCGIERNLISTSYTNEKLSKYY